MDLNSTFRPRIPNSPWNFSFGTKIAYHLLEQSIFGNFKLKPFVDKKSADLVRVWYRKLELRVCITWQGWRFWLNGKVTSGGFIKAKARELFQISGRIFYSSLNNFIIISSSSKTGLTGPNAPYTRKELVSFESALSYFSSSLLFSAFLQPLNR